MKRFIISIILLMIAVPCWGATHYISESTGAESAQNGESSAAPWQQLDHIEDHGWASGDKVLLMCGDTWSKSAGDWGSVGDRIYITNETNLTIGAYYLDGATPREVDGVTYKCSDDSTVDPIIDGNVSSGWGTSTYDAILWVDSGTTGLVIQDVQLKNYYRGVSIRQITSESTAISDITIQRCNFDNFGLGWIYIEPQPTGTDYPYDNISDITIQDNTMTKAQLSYPEGASGWGNCIKIYTADNVIVRRNIMGQCSGELVNFKMEADDGECYDNIGWDVDGGTFKVVNSDNVSVHHNFAIHTGDATYSYRSRAGLTMSSESDDYTVASAAVTDPSNNKFYSNVVAGYMIGIWINDGQDDADSGSATNYVYNNTFIDCGNGASSNGGTYRLPTPGDVLEFEVEIANNLSVINDITNGEHYAYADVNSNITFAGNGWDESDPTDTSYCTSSDCDDGTDVTGDPDLVDPAACGTSWRGCAAYDTPLPGDAALGASSDFIGVGADLGLGSSYLGLNPNSEWVDDVNTLNQDTYTPWEMGAYVYTAPGPVVPTYPLQGAAGNFKYN